MKIMVIGCGRMGSGLAEIMQRRGHTVTVVDRTAAAFDALGATFGGQTVVGNALDRTTLQRAGIAHTDGLAVVTNSDEINIVVARLARTTFQVPLVVARVVEPHKAEIYERLGLHTIATTTWGIHRMANLLSRADWQVQTTLGNEVDVVAVDVPVRWAGRTVFHLTVPGEIQVVAITRGGKTFLPSSGAALQTGDTVHLATLAASADRIKHLLG
jgi:trk system potassium uptake protein TrkA